MYVKLPDLDPFKLTNRSGTPEWVWRYPAERFYHIAYGVTDGMLPAAFNLARNRHAGLVYFTELGLPNPYGKLASHFSRQVRLVQG